MSALSIIPQRPPRVNADRAQAQSTYWSKDRSPSLSVAEGVLPGRVDKYESVPPVAGLSGESYPEEVGSGRLREAAPNPEPARQYTRAPEPVGQQNVPALDPVRQSLSAPTPAGEQTATVALFIPAGQSAAPSPTLQVSPKIGATRPKSMLIGFSYFSRFLSDIGNSSFLASS
ncbi:MAG: hypothetical protein AB7V22_12440 [Kiritimatiellia bacterium]